MRLKSGIFAVALSAAAAMSGCLGLARLGAIDQAQKLQNQGRYEEALEETDLALGITKDKEQRAQLIFIKARCFEELDRVQEAEGLYQYLQEQCPETPFAYQARARLNMMEKAAPSSDAGPPSGEAP